VQRYGGMTPTMRSWTQEGRAMKGSGSALFTDAGDYQAILPLIAHMLVTPAKGGTPELDAIDGFAPVSWARVGAAHWLCFIAPEMAFIVFPVHRSSVLICAGVLLTMGDIAVLGPGQQLHLRTTGHAAWGAIAVTPASLRTFGETLAGHDVGSASFGQILRLHGPSKKNLLLRYHAEAMRIVETQLSHFGQAEVACALRQDLMWALVTGFVTAEPRRDSVVMRQHATILARFETAMLVRADRPPRIAEVCNTIGVQERTPRSYCRNVLGMGAVKYSQLRHLERARLALLQARDTTASEDSHGSAHSPDDATRRSCVQHCHFRFRIAAPLHALVRFLPAMCSDRQLPSRSGLKAKCTRPTSHWGRCRLQRAHGARVTPGEVPIRLTYL
jgi:AraC-like DNA-binding protein